MLELNGIKCWVTSADLAVLPETLNYNNASQVAGCTVKLPTTRKASNKFFPDRVKSISVQKFLKQSFIIHWCSTTPITAWCEVNLKNSVGKISTGVVKCEMDANNPNTQKRSTQEYRGVSGRNLAFGGRKISTSANLGTAWVEIRRATAIEVNEVSTTNKKLTITWVASDHPETGVPYATFIINFQLDEQAMNAVTDSPSLSSPGILSTPIIRSSSGRDSTEERVENGLLTLDSPNDVTSSASTVNTLTVESGTSETMVQDPAAQVSSGNGVTKRGRSDSQTENTPDAKRSRVDNSEAVVPTTPVQNPQIPEAAAPQHIQRPEVATLNIPKVGLKIPKVVIPSIPGVSLVGTPVQNTGVPDVHPPSVPGTQTPEVPAPKTPTTPTQTQMSAPAPEVLVPKTPTQTQTPKIIVPKTPIKSTQLQEMDLYLSDDDGDDFEAKLAIIEVELEACAKTVAKMTEKEKYMKIKFRRVQSISEIKSLETIYGPIPSKTPTQDNWDSIQNDVSDDETSYSENRIHMEETLPSLESYRLALQYKKLYIEKKTMLKMMRNDVHSIGQRCDEISGNITDILSTTPNRTPS